MDKRKKRLTPIHVQPLKMRQSQTFSQQFVHGCVTALKVSALLLGCLIVACIVCLSPLLIEAAPTYWNNWLSTYSVELCIALLTIGVAVCIYKTTAEPEQLRLKQLSQMLRTTLLVLAMGLGIVIFYLWLAAPILAIPYALKHLLSWPVLLCWSIGLPIAIIFDVLSLGFVFRWMERPPDLMDIIVNTAITTVLLAILIPVFSRARDNALRHQNSATGVQSSNASTK